MWLRLRLLDRVYRQRVLSANDTLASARSLRRWRNERLRRLPLRGNRQSVILNGHDRFLLALYRKTYPKARADEIIAFIANNSPIFRVYSCSDITRTENFLGLSRKVGSTTARQAQTPENIYRHHLFWTQPHPLGVQGIPRRLLIDLDECALFLVTANRRYGKAYLGIRVRTPGPYGQTERLNLLAGVAATGERWLLIYKHGGNTTARSFDRHTPPLFPHFIPCHPPFPAP